MVSNAPASIAAVFAVVANAAICLAAVIGAGFIALAENSVGQPDARHLGPPLMIVGSALLDGFIGFALLAKTKEPRVLGVLLQAVAILFAVLGYLGLRSDAQKFFLVWLIATGISTGLSWLATLGRPEEPV